MAEFLNKRKIKFGYETRRIKFVSKVQSGVCLTCGTNTVGKKRTYVADFSVGGIVIETKGRLTPSERTKLLAIRASNPGLDLRLVFQRDNKLRYGSETKYSEWASKHNFAWHIGVKLPTKWVRELRKAAVVEVTDEQT